MPTASDIRAQVLLELKAQGADVATEVAHQLDILKDKASALAGEWIDGTKTAKEFQDGMSALSGELNFFGKMSKDLEDDAKRVQKAIEDEEAAFVKLTMAIAKARETEEKLNAKAAADAQKVAADKARAIEQEEKEYVALQKAVADARALEEKLNAKAAADAQKVAADKQRALEKEEQEYVELQYAVAAARALEAKINAKAVADAQKAAADKQKAIEQEEADYVKMMRAKANAMAAADKVQAGSAEAGKKFGYGMLNIAHAMQDAQYGFGALLNNIPLVVQALGGGPGLAGGIMIAGVAFEILKGHIGDVTVQLGMMIDPIQAFARTTDDLKAKIAGLESRTFKLDVDYTDIELARLELEKLTEAEAAYNAAKKTKMQGTFADEAKKVVDVMGGSGALSKFILEAGAGAGMQFAKQSDLDERTKLIGLIEADRKSMEGKGAAARALIGVHLRTLQSEKDAVEKKIEEANKNEAAAQAGRFLTGDEDVVATVKGLARKRPGALTAEARRKLAELPDTPYGQMIKDLLDDNEKFAEGLKKERLAAEKVAAGKAESAAKLVEAQANRGIEGARQQADAAIRSGISTYGAEKKGHGGVVGAEALALAAKGLGPMEMRPQLVESELKRLTAAGVDASTRDEIARGIVNDVVEKVFAQLTQAVGNVGANAQKAIQAAAADAAADAEKEAKKEAAEAKAAARDRGKQDVAARKLAIAGQIGMTFEGNLTDDQALAGAEFYQKQLADHVNPAVAQNRTLAKMNQFLAENIRTTQALVGTNAEMEMMLEGALTRIGVLTMQANMIEGRVKNAGAKGGAIVPHTMPVRRR